MNDISRYIQYRVYDEYKIHMSDDVCIDIYSNIHRMMYNDVMYDHMDSNRILLDTVYDNHQTIDTHVSYINRLKSHIVDINGKYKDIYARYTELLHNNSIKDREYDDGKRYTSIIDHDYNAFMKERSVDHTISRVDVVHIDNTIRVDDIVHRDTKVILDNDMMKYMYNMHDDDILYRDPYTNTTDVIVDNDDNISDSKIDDKKTDNILYDDNIIDNNDDDGIRQDEMKQENKKVPFDYHKFRDKRLKRK